MEDVNHEVYGCIYSQMIFGESFQEPVSPEAVTGFTAQRQALVSAASIYPDLEKLTLGFSLARLREALGADAGLADTGRSVEAEAVGSAVIQRWIVRTVAPGALEPCVVIRFRERENARRKDGADVEPDRRP